MLEPSIEGIEGLEIVDLENSSGKGFPIPTTPCSCSMNGIQTLNYYFIIGADMVNLFTKNGTASMSGGIAICPGSATAIRAGLLIGDLGGCSSNGHLSSMVRDFAVSRTPVYLPRLLDYIRKDCINDL